MTTIVAFDANIEAKTFALSVEDDITSMRFIIAGQSHFASVRNFAGDLPEFGEKQIYFQSWPAKITRSCTLHFPGISFTDFGWFRRM